VEERTVTDRTIGPEGVVDDEDVEGHRLASNDNETVPDDEPADVKGHRLAANDNETVNGGHAAPEGDAVEAHRLASNDDETLIADDDVEGHRLAANDNETVVDD
jgi:hypothetical protein